MRVGDAIGVGLEAGGGSGSQQGQRVASVCESVSGQWLGPFRVRGVTGNREAFFTCERFYI